MTLKDNGAALTLAATGAVAIIGEIAARSKDTYGTVSVMDQVFGSAAQIDKSRHRAAFGAAVGSVVAGPLGAGLGGAIGAPTNYKGRASGGAFGAAVISRFLMNPVIERKAQERADARAMNVAANPQTNPPTVVPSKVTMMDIYYATPFWVRAVNLAAAATGAYLSVPEDM